MMTTNLGKKLLLAICIAGATGAVAADDKGVNGLEGITANDLLQLLVKEGIVNPEKLKDLSEKIKARERKQSEAAVEPIAQESRDKKVEEPAGVVRVPYIPTFVRDEIRDQVRVGLKEDVTNDVLAQAKTERWGIPGVTPEWVDRTKFYGDMRLRIHSDRFGANNEAFSYANLNGINSGGSSQPTANYTNFYNTTEDRNRLRARFRLGVTSKITNTVEAGGRIVTGSQSDPGSANQTIGTYGGKYPTDFDLAYLRYTSIDKGLYLSGGRIANPFVSTELIWHPDLTFEGLASTWWLLRSEDLTAEFQQFDPFITAGIFPIQEINQSSRDKWLYASQLGFNYTFDNQSKLGLGLAYYYYSHLVGQKNEAGFNDKDFTAPDFFQKGNTVFNIANPDPSTTNTPGRYALAADYHLANLVLNYDYAGFSPFHVLLTADYVKNIGFDKHAVSLLVDESGDTQVDTRNKGYLLRIAAGWPVVQKRYDWQVSLTYKYLERDAVVDAFTDSDFHLGGTDGKGYTLRFDYGLTDNTVFSARWISTDEIDGQLISGSTPFPGVSTSRNPLAVDTLLLDVNAKF